MSNERNFLIVAPHPDDELIGCFEILNDLDKKIAIIYNGDTDKKRRLEAMQIRELFPNVQHQAYHTSIPTPYLNENTTIYVPDPLNELHPAHRAWGFLGESLARDGYDVIFYTTNMNVQYIHEVKDSLKKETLLNRVYSSQKELWKYEKKYVLFEGRCKWVF